MVANALVGGEVPRNAWVAFVAQVAMFLLSASDTQIRRFGCKL
jgi:hypothetical protein